MKRLEIIVPGEWQCGKRRYTVRVVLTPEKLAGLVQEAARSVDGRVTRGGGALVVLVRPVATKPEASAEQLGLEGRRAS